ncbi:MAG: hypothetical protein KDC34_11180, partial [Saprospiraceae bacterium]|nr:hypothetical protein [Saprospiraceae bacterium]
CLLGLREQSRQVFCLVGQKNKVAKISQLSEANSQPKGVNHFRLGIESPRIFYLISVSIPSVS